MGPSTHSPSAQMENLWVGSSYGAGRSYAGSSVPLQVNELRASFLPHARCAAQGALLSIKTCVQRSWSKWASLTAQFMTNDNGTSSTTDQICLGSRLHVCLAFRMHTELLTLKRHTPPDADKVPAELIEAGRKIVRSKINKLVNSTWKEEQVSQQWKKS